jgi:hypothetical protein
MAESRLHLHVKHTAMKIVNFQRMGNLRIVRFGIFAAEYTTVVNVIEQNLCFCSGTAEKIKLFPHYTQYLVVVPYLYMKCAIGRKFNTPLSFAVGNGIKGNLAKFQIIGVNKRSFLPFALACQLESNCYTVCLFVTVRHTATRNNKKKQE